MKLLPFSSFEVIRFLREAEWEPEKSFVATKVNKLTVLNSKRLTKLIKLTTLCNLLCSKSLFPKQAAGPWLSRLRPDGNCFLTTSLSKLQAGLEKKAQNLGRQRPQTQPERITVIRCYKHHCHIDLIFCLKKGPDLGVEKEGSWSSHLKNGSLALFKHEVFGPRQKELVLWSGTSGGCWAGLFQHALRQGDLWF